MDFFSQDYMSEYHKEFERLPREYYDSGCRDWREELTHQPEIPDSRQAHNHDPKGYSDETKYRLIRVNSARRHDKTPPSKRNRMYYAVKYANIFAYAARLAEHDSQAMPDKEYHRLLDFQKRYEELQAILNGVKPCDFYRYNVCIPVSAVDIYGRIHWDKCKTWNGEPAESIQWEHWPDREKGGE